jgi:preprotein translocase subunit SecE
MAMMTDTVTEKVSLVNRINFYIKDVVAELKKVTWASREELMGSTSVVIVLSLLLAGFLLVVDFILARIMNLLF